MLSIQKIIWVSLFLLLNTTICQGKHPQEKTKVVLDIPRLKETTHRYFSSIGGYQEGDLISQSQLDEFLVYLRKTRGHSPATHPRLLKRALPDESRLIQLFYKKNGAEVLRVAAEITGSYESFDRLSRKGTDYANLVKVVEEGSIEKLKEMVEADTQARLAADNEKRSKNNHRVSRIYTVDDYLAAVSVNLDKQKKAEEASKPQQ